VSGDGHVVSQQRNTDDFNSLDVSGGIKVQLRQEPARSVKVEIDQNLQEYIELYNDGKTLVIKQREGYNLNPSKDVVVYVAAPMFKDIEVSGACDIRGTGPLSSNEEMTIDASGASTVDLQITAGKLRSDLSGSCHVNLKGQVNELSIHASGSSDIRAFDLVADNVELDLSGSSDAEVNANKRLDVEASGASHVIYKGKPSITQKSSGASEVRPAG
jgi:hypothetical protein